MTISWHGTLFAFLLLAYNISGILLSLVDSSHQGPVMQRFNVFFLLPWTYNCPWYDDVIKWKHFPRYCPFVRGIHRSPVNSLHKGQWRGALMFSLICVSINGWVNNCEAGDLRRHRAHYDVTVMDLRHHDPPSCDITVMLHNFFGYHWFEIMCWMIDHTSITMVVTYFRIQEFMKFYK